MSSPAPLSLELPADVVEALAQRAAELVVEHLDQQASGGRWVRGAKGIAAYLDLPVSTAEKLIARQELPVSRPMGAGGPIFARTAELDRWAGASELEPRGYA